MLSLISARRAGKQTTEEWVSAHPARSCRSTVIFPVPGPGPLPLVGWSGAASVWYYEVWSDCNAPVLLPGAAIHLQKLNLFIVSDGGRSGN